MPVQTTSTSLVAVVMLIAGIVSSAQVAAQQAQPPQLPARVYEAFVAAGYRPAAVIVVLEGGEHELFEVSNHPFAKGPIDTTVLKRPEVTIQDASSSCSKVICTRYTCTSGSC